MAEIINYIWQSTFCLLFFFGIYWCFLREEKAFTLTRVFILTAPVMALLFPVMEIPVDFAKPSISLEHTGFLQSLTAFEAEEEIAGTYGLPEFTVKGTKLPILLELKDYLIIGYLIIFFLLSLRLLWQLFQFNMLLRKGWYQTVYKLKGGYFLVPTFGLAPVFSFFDKLFWDDTQHLRPDEKDHIFRHEIEHIRQGHSWDIMYYQILGIFFWFNPAIYLMRTALIDIHEYSADAHVLKGTANKESYKKLVVKIAFKGLDLPIGNYFIRSTTLKRIMMMKKSGKTNWLKLVMVLPLTAMLLGLVAMKTMPDPEFTDKSSKDNLTMIKRYLSANDSIKVTTKVKRIESPVHYEYVSGLNNGKITAQIGKLQYEIGDISDTEEYRKVLEMIGIFKQHSAPIKTYPQHDLEKDPDKMPAPVGGMTAWVQFLSKNLKMPAEAKELGANGTIYVEFIVDKEGKILSPVIKKSLGMGLDDEVLRMMSSPDLPKWMPGTKDAQAVKTLMTLPVQFHTDQMEETSPFFPQVAKTAPPREPQQADLFNVVEQMPIPEGGLEGWNDYVDDHLQYPEAAKAAGIEGTVYVSFTVNKEGKLMDPQILRGIGGGADEEALRLILSASNWIPGVQNGNKVNVKIRVPIQFTLPEKKKDEAAISNNSSKNTAVSTQEPIFEEATKKFSVTDPGFPNQQVTNHYIDISLENNNQVLVRGRRVKMEELKGSLSAEMKKLKADNVDQDQILALIKTKEVTTSVEINTVVEILRNQGIHKTVIDSISYKTVSPVLIFNQP